MRNVVILGAGGAAAELTFYIEDNNSKVEKQEQINILGYIDYTKDYWEKYKFKAPILCDIDSYTPGPEEEVLIAVGDMASRKKRIDFLLQRKARKGGFMNHSVIKPKDLK